jgi:hypothetical protein
MKTIQRLTAAAILTALGLTPGGSLIDSAEPAREGVAEIVARVDRRVIAWQPSAKERRLDEIGWARDIRDALRLAREYHRPIFLFTYSGSAEREHAIALERC